MIRSYYYYLCLLRFKYPIALTIVLDITMDDYLILSCQLELILMELLCATFSVIILWHVTRVQAE